MVAAAARDAARHLDALAQSLRAIAEIAPGSATVPAPSGADISQALLEALNRNQSPELVRALRRVLK